MQLPQLLVLCAAAISLWGGGLYVRDMFLGNTKPNRVTWFLWAAAPLIGAGAAYAAGADIWALVRIILAGLIPLIVVVASFFLPSTRWTLSKFDYLCGAASVVALVFWLLLDHPVLAVLLAALADAFAAIPTVRKAWEAPETETAGNYIASLISVILVLPSIPTWNIPNASFPIYLLLVNSLLIVLICRGRMSPVVRPRNTSQLN